MHTEQRSRARRRYFYKSSRTDEGIKKQYIGPETSVRAKLLWRIEQLRMAEDETHMTRLTEEQQATQLMSDRLNQLDAVLSHWKVLAELTQRYWATYASDPLNASIQKSEHKPRGIMVTKQKLPGLYNFRRLCRLADEGDSKSSEELEKLVEQCPEMIREATDLVGLAHTQLLDSIGRESVEAKQMLTLKISLETKELRAAMAGHPLSPLMADALMVTWLDTLWCLIGSMRKFRSSSLTRFWEKAKGRADERLDRMQQRSRSLLKSMSSQSSAART